MKFISTRGNTPATSLSAAIAAGLAPDGGLYVPESMPQFATEDFSDCHNLPGVAMRLLAPFFADDELASHLPAICAEAFTFDASLRALTTPRNCLLELFHGPTAAFKDFGARFLAACMRRIPRTSDQPLTILVATSGDTGAAVAAAFAAATALDNEVARSATITPPPPRAREGKGWGHTSGFRVVILYPDGRVSPRQAHQLGCFGGSVTALRVAGSFDDCQGMVKQAFADAKLRARVPLSSANSISLGRLLPQMSYYAQASLVHQRAQGTPLNFVVPTGNLGNALACVLARAAGLPIGRIALATNANRTLPDFFAGADYSPRVSEATLANAMDVGAPSNFERLRWLYPVDANLRGEFSVQRIDDDTIRATIRERFTRDGDVFCPHTATAIRTLEHLRETGTQGDWAVAATAHPAKFDSIVEPLIGQAVTVPPALAKLLAHPSHAQPLANNYAALREHLLQAMPQR